MLKQIFIFLSFYFLSLGSMVAQDGSLDVTFNPNDVGFGNGDGGVSILSSALLSDGKIIVVGGFTTYNGTLRNRIARLNEDGTLDVSFNPGTGTNSSIETLAIQSDGKIIIGGQFSSYNGINRLGIARIDTNGNLDTSFDPGSGANNFVQTISIQSDGKIIIGGWFTSYNGTARNRIARLNIDGSLDFSFNPGTGASDVVRTSVIQADGKIILGGNFTSCNGTTINRIARMNSDGTLDGSFNPGTGPDAIVFSSVLQADGKIIITGEFTSVNGSSRSKISRLNANGTLDTGFNPGTGANYAVNNAVVQSDGKIIIGGNFLIYNGTFLNRVARLNTDGSVDVSFNCGTAADNTVMTILIRPDGKIMVSGYILSFNGTGKGGIVRLYSDGTHDTNFNLGTSANNRIYTTSIQSDGKIIIGGAFLSYNGIGKFRIARLNVDGTLDSGFDTGTGANDIVYSSVIQSDGKIIIVGDFTSIDGVSRNRIARLNQDGSLDASFDPGFGAGDVIYSVAVQADGKIIIVGNFFSYNQTGIIRIARLHSNGNLDFSFSPGTGPDSILKTVALQPDGKIIIVGSFDYYNSIIRKRIARLNINGTLDMSFDPGTGANDEVKSFAIQPDGKIIIVGPFTQVNGINRNCVARLNENGTLDVGFNIGTGAIYNVFAVNIQPDGKIIIGGMFNTFNGTSRNRIARLNSNGSLDGSFNPGTGANSDVGTISSQVDGKIIIGGDFTGYNGTGKNRVARILSCWPLYGTDVISACDSFTWIDGNTYTSNNNTATYNLISAAGCDSIVTLNLTINYSNSGTDIIIACDSLIWMDGNTYYSSNNIATYVLTNTVGCDSIITLNLTILNPTISTDTQSSCDSLIWMDGNTYYSSNNIATYVLPNSVGCDSIITLNLTILNSTFSTDVQTVCDSLIWIDGITYYSSNNLPIFTLINSIGCDSIVSLDLTIIPSLPITINTFSLPSDDVNCVGELAVTTSGNADYILDIDDGSILGSSSGYEVIQNLCIGVHSLKITDFCSDTLLVPFVIPVDSNYIFNNPYIDSMAIDSLGVTMTNCTIYYNSIDTAYIDSIFTIGNSVTVIWNIIDSNGSNYDTSTYVLNNGNGVYFLQLSIFCPTKALGEYFTVTEGYYFETGTSSIEENQISDSNYFKVYPNPTRDAVIVNFTENEGTLLVYDSKSRLISKTVIKNGETVSLKDKSNGLYFLELTTCHGKMIRRVVKE